MPPDVTIDFGENFWAIAAAAVAVGGYVIRFLWRVSRFYHRLEPVLAKIAKLLEEHEWLKTSHRNLTGRVRQNTHKLNDHDRRLERVEGPPPAQPTAEGAA